MKILAIDAGQKTTGIAYFVDGELKSLGYLRISQDKTLTDTQNFLYRVQQVSDFLVQLDETIDLVVIEAAKKGFKGEHFQIDFLCKNYAYNMFIQWHLIGLDIPCLEVNESTARSKLKLGGTKLDPEKGKGRLKKIAFRKALGNFEELGPIIVQKRYIKRTGTPKDEAFDMVDAYILGKYYLETQ